MRGNPWRVSTIISAVLLGALIGLGGWFPARAADAPPNDNFAQAELLTGATGSVSGSNVGATKEPDEPDNAAGASVWYRWAAPASGAVRFSTAGSSFDTILGVYTGSAVDKLTPVAFNDDAGKDLTSEVNFTASAGEVYFILVDGVFGESGDFFLNWGAVGPPANDHFTDAHVLSGAAGFVAGSTVAATSEAGEPAHAGAAGDASVWYQWEAPGDGTYALQLAAGFDAALAAYTGNSLASLTPAGAAVGPFASVGLTAAAGTVYHIAVDGTAPGASGDFTLEWRAVVSNDNFADAEPISGASGELAGNTSGATREKDEPFHAGNHGVVSVWYRWQPETSGETVFFTSGAAFDTLLAVYTGDELPALVEVAANDDRGLSGHSEVRFAATAGVDYFIAVDGVPGKEADDSGPFTLTWGPPPPNDNFASAAPLTGASGEVSGSTHGATAEPGEAPGDAASIWYAFTPPHAGVFVFDTDGCDFEAVLRFATGNAIGTLTQVQSASSRETALRAEAGTVYYVTVDGRKPCSSGGTCGAPDVGHVVLRWQHVPPPANDDFANAQPLPGGSGSLITSNLAATKEPGEPNHAGRTGGASLWYTWTAPASGSFTFDLSGSDNADLIGVYTGTAVDQLTETLVQRTLASRPKVRLSATAGQQYFIAIDQLVGRAGQIAFAWSPAPANDDFAAATVITGAIGEIAGTTLGATLEQQEPPHNFDPVDATVWYAWQAPASGVYSFAVDAAEPAEAQPAVYTGTALGMLTPVGSSGGSPLAVSAVGGQIYRIAVAGRCFTSVTFGGLSFLSCSPLGAFTLNWSPVAAPSNDDLVNAQQLTGAAGEVIAALDGATHEPGEPQHGDREGAASVWYRWSPPADQFVTFDTFGNTVLNWTLLAVYTGENYSKLTPVARINDPGEVDLNPNTDPLAIRNNKITFLARADTAYLIAVDMKAEQANSGIREPVTLRWGPPPTNDSFASAMLVTGASGAADGTLLGASIEAGEPATLATGSVWYRWTAPATGTVRLSADGFRLGVFTGSSPGDLVAVPTGLDPGGSDAEVFDAAAGTTYFLRVRDVLLFAPFCGGDCPLHGVAQGPFQLQWHTLPSNDFFDRPQTLTGSSGTALTDNTGATSELGEPDHGSLPPSASLWFEWTAPASGIVTFYAQGDGLVTVLGAYVGDILSNLHGAGAAKPSDGAARMQFAAEGGVTYRIAVDSFGATGPLTLRWGPPPPNDHFSAATVLTGADGAISGTTFGATREDFEPDHFFTPGFASVWYRWTAPHTAVTRLDTSGSGFATVVGVYTGASLGELVELTGLDAPGAAFFDAVAGTEYFIAVDGLDPEFCTGCPPSEGQLSLAWSQLRLAVANVEVTESNDGSVVASFPLTLSFAADRPVTVQAATVDGTAQAPSDYTAASVLVSFAPGETEQAVAVSIRGDLLKEATETFQLTLSQPTGAYLPQSAAAGTIVDNDPNAAPGVTAFTVPQQAVKAGTPVAVTVAFTDADPADVHTVSVSWGDGVSSAATVTESGGSGTATAAHAYSAPGIYTVQAAVSDGTATTNAADQYVIVVDDSKGSALHVAGKFDSPVGAVTAQPDAAGEGKLQANVRYLPDGRLEGTLRLDLKPLGLELNAMAFEWLIVKSGSAFARGQGTLPGQGSVGVLLSVTESQTAGTPDRIRIKVWRLADGAVVYDTAPGLADDAAPVTALKNGTAKVKLAGGG